MDFPIADLLDEERACAWLRTHFHPDGLACPRCQAGYGEAYRFRRTRRDRVQVYRCKRCHRTYSVYTGTLFERRHLSPSAVVLLLRGFLQGTPTARLARELSLSRTTVHAIRKGVHAGALALQPTGPLPDARTETGEMFTP